MYPNYPYSPAAPVKTTWWNRRSKAAKIALGTVGALLVIGVLSPSQPVTSATATPTTGTTAKPASAAPANGFGPGTYLVGSDIAPGTYRASVDGIGCYWERMKDATGGFNAIIANDYVSDGQALVTIKATDVAFKSQGCTDWVKIA